MDRKRTFDKVKIWLVHHWLLLIVSLIAGSFLLLLGAKSIREIKMSTPIASIALEDSLRLQGPPTRLESYRKEMEEINKQHIRRQIAMEKIIAMDFGSQQEKENHRDPQPDSLQQPVKEQREEANPLVLYKEKEKPPQRTRKPEKPSVSLAPEVAMQERYSSIQERYQSPFFITKPGDEEKEKAVAESGKVPRLFSAVVNGDQQLKINGTLSLRLLEEVEVEGQRFPRNTLVYGRLSGGSRGRLKISITKIHAVPVKMQVYDQDEQPGIPYIMDEPVPAALEEGGEDVVDRLMYSIPYGGVLGGVAEAGRRMIRKGRKSKAIYLTDGYPLYIGVDKNNAH